MQTDLIDLNHMLLNIRFGPPPSASSPDTSSTYKNILETHYTVEWNQLHITFVCSWVKMLIVREWLRRIVFYYYFVYEGVEKGRRPCNELCSRCSSSSSLVVVVLVTGINISSVIIARFFMFLYKKNWVSAECNTKEKVWTRRLFPHIKTTTTYSPIWVQINNIRTLHPISNYMSRTVYISLFSPSPDTLINITSSCQLYFSEYVSDRAAEHYP